MSRTRTRRTTTPHGSRFGAFLIFVVVAFLLGGLTEWTPVPDGVVGFLAVAVACVALLAGGGRRRASRGRRYR